MFLTKDRVKQLIQNAPQGTKPEEIVRELMRRGYTLEGLNEPKKGVLRQVAEAVVKPVARFGVQAANVAESLYDISRGDVRGAAEATSKTRVLPGLGAVSPYVKGTDTTTQAIRGTIGGGLELGSMIAPVGKVGLGAKGLASAAGRFGVASATGDVGSQLASDKPLSARQAITSGALGAAIPVAGRSLAAGLRSGGKIGAEILGKTTGTSADVIQEAFTNPNVMRIARKSGSEGVSELQNKALSDARQGFKSLLNSRRFDYTERLKKIKANKSDITPIVDTGRQRARSLLADFDISVGEGKRLNNLDFSDSTIVKNQEIVQKAFNKVMSWTDNTPEGVDRLKKILSQYEKEIPVTESGGAKIFVSELKDTIKTGLEQRVPGYSEMTGNYHAMSNLISEVESALSLGNKSSKDTAIRKIISTMRDNNELRKDFIRLLGTASGKDITGTVAASALSKAAPHGLAGRITGSGGALAAAFLKPSSIPLLIAVIGASSPRLVGEITSVLGKATRQMVKADKFSPAIRNTLRLILQRAYSESNK